MRSFSAMLGLLEIVSYISLLPMDPRMYRQASMLVMCLHSISSLTLRMVIDRPTFGFGLYC